MLTELKEVREAVKTFEALYNLALKLGETKLDAALVSKHAVYCISGINLIEMLGVEI